MRDLIGDKEIDDSDPYHPNETETQPKQLWQLGDSWKSQTSHNSEKLLN